MARLMYNVKDVQEILGVGESKAYQFIRILNEELRGKGFLTVQGNATNNIDATNDTNATQMKLRYQG